MPRKSRIEAWDSTPFLNYLFEIARDCSQAEYEDLQKQMMAFHQSRRHFPRDGRILSPVEFAKFALGKQDYTWTGSQRNWVWERGDWRLFVNNTQGFSFEVREGLSLEKARTAWDDCRARLGAYDMYPAGTRLLCYADDEPGTSRGPDPRYPGHFLVDLDDGSRTTADIDNLVKA